MDANGTRYHLARTRSDWMGAPAATSPPVAPAEIEWSADNAHVTLLRRAAIAESVLPPRDPVADRRGAGRDRYGNWYWIDDTGGAIRFRGHGRRDPEAFSPPGPPRADVPRGAFRPWDPAPVAPTRLAGLAVTTEHYLVVGALDRPGLLVYDLHGGGPPLRLTWPSDVAFTPFDIAPSPDGGVVVLARDPGRLWIVDRWMRIDGGSAGAPPGRELDFAPSCGPRPPAPPPGPIRDRIEADMAIDVSWMDEPIAVEVLPDGSVFVLDAPAAGPSSVHWYRERARAQTIELVRREPGSPPPTIATPARAYDMAFLPDKSSSAGIAGLLAVVSDRGAEAYAHRLELNRNTGALDHVFVADNYPLHKFEGRALVVGPDGAASYDSSPDARWVPLAKDPRAHYSESGRVHLPPVGVGTPLPGGGWAYDGKEPGCVWHRIVLDACIPPRTAVRLESRAADDPAELPSTPWQAEPLPYARSIGSEIPFQRPADGSEGTFRSWETLFQRARGRYVQLRMTLLGDGRSSPQLRALRIHYPRFSYLREYLPAVFSDEPVSAAFLDRYLANPEGLLTALEDRITDAQALFDLRTIPAEYLDWLAGWFGLELDPAWNEARRRLVLRNAPQFFRERGTRAGMLRAIRLAIEACADDSLFSEDVTGPPRPGFQVRVVEQFLTRTASGIVYGDPTASEAPRQALRGSDWTPEHGAEALHRSFRAFLAERYDGDFEALMAAWGGVDLPEGARAGSDRNFENPHVRFTGVEPQHPTMARDWSDFREGPIGFAYERVRPEDLGFYTEYLARRYRSAAKLTAAYEQAGIEPLTELSRREVEAKIWRPHLLCTLPETGPPLRDWIEFVSSALVAQRKAHRFVVLVPVAPEEPAHVQLRKLAVARRVAELEKPAHAAFDARLYWAAFRVGEARAGLETVVGRGSRSTAIVLGESYLAAAHLAVQPPHGSSARWLLGGSAPTPPCRGDTEETLI